MKYKLSDLINIKHGFAFESKYFIQEKEGETDLILVTPGNVAIGGGFQDKKLRYYSECAPLDKKYVFEPEDIIVNMTDLSKNGDTLGFSARIPRCINKTFLHNQRIGKVINIRDDLILNDYLYLLLQTREYRHHVLSTATGTTVRHTSPSRILEFQFELPDLKQQKLISSIILSFDYMIENNNAIISNLEEQAQAIFKSWFIDFEPFQDGNFVDSELGKIPEGWEVGKLGNSSLGKLLKSGISNFENEKVYLATADVTDSKITNYDTKITFDRRPSRANMQPIKNSLWFAKMKNSRKLIYVGENNDFLVNKVVFSTGFAGINASELGINYLWTYLLTEDFNAKKDLYSNGTTMQAINNTNINKIKIVIPEKSVLEAFNDLVKPMYKLISNYEHQNIKLSNIRDTLLPKLMSGELRLGQDDIEDIESQI